ncbi:MAG: DNA adenine methylase [Armatimonadetes bacterium]|nr:DNA adenine methylase [Armatimonadota bacterium]PIU66828.1 MAG: modification methylase [Armatimonadetes bacterium CG07_land_8_20_14_0_80_59_28]PIY43941.1 MAG: modification methylase [Armatimonadetes bacterium CG_4_10_14_3_um_filter_59_10]PJB67554.1 MAG: modification methylase [Armatimonadetes bacterium CG_4_9_14_3_um_filter_58_7]
MLDATEDPSNRGDQQCSRPLEARLGRVNATGHTKHRYRSPLRYPGGKSKAIEQILPLLPRQVGEYREPMVGGGSVFLAARSAGIAERYWINDLFPDLYAFWTTVQDTAQCARLQDELESLRCSFSDPAETKEYFLNAREEEPADPFRQAFLFFFFNRVTFSGTTRAGGFSSQASTRRFTASSIQRLTPMPDALGEVKITNLDFQEIIDAPGEDVFVFLDPPYFSAERLYGKKGGLHEFDHERLAATLRNTPHRFLMTYDDCPAVREFYSWANLRPWRLQYGMSNCNRENTARVGAELFVSNYDPQVPESGATDSQYRLNFA